MAVAGHTGDAVTARAGLVATDPAVRSAALGALDRLDRLDDDTVRAALADPDVTVRRRAVTLAAVRPAVDLTAALSDADPSVVEVAAWACGEREATDESTLHRLIALAGSHDDPLVREAGVAALGALGEDLGLPAILAATSDKPAVRRRAVLALAPFLDPDHPSASDVTAALERALADRDWQVRQAAEDLLPHPDDPRPHPDDPLPHPDDPLPHPDDPLPHPDDPRPHHD